MGWASAGPTIFEPVVFALIAAEIEDEKLTDLVEQLIGVLAAEDWDTVGESLNDFKDHPAVVAGFNRHGYVSQDQYLPDGQVDGAVRCMMCDQMVGFTHAGGELRSVQHPSRPGGGEPCSFSGKDPWGY